MTTLSPPDAVSAQIIRLGVAALIVLAMFLLSAGPARAVTIVSLGDSYSSGEGTSPYDSETDRNGNKCHRSPGAWPRLIGAKEARHLACSGAVVNDILRQEGGQTYRGRDSVSQLKQLTAIRRRMPIDYATVTIGGNDLGFAAKLKQCYKGLRDCLSNREALKDELPGLRKKLSRAYWEINQATVGGTVLVVGYPDIFPPPSRGDRCGWLSPGEKRNIEWFSGKVDDTLSEAADAARVSYLPIRNALAGHELCTGTSWVRSLGLGASTEIPGNQQQGHPLKEGQTAIALKVLAWMRKNPRPGVALPAAPAPPPPDAAGSEQAGSDAPPPAGPGVPGGSVPETTGGATNTWTNPANAGGSRGATIAGGQTVGIACKLQGFKVANGNPWWYRIASSPWDSQFYASADAFYNNGQTSGSLLGTPWVDPNVPDCAAPQPPPPPSTRTVVVDNRVTNGGSQMREDSPAYLSTVMQNFCKRNGCALPGTDMGSGAYITAECTALGNRTTNGQDGSSIDDGNPGLYSSMRWYGIRWGDGRFGYISEVWIRADFRGGLGLRGC